MLVRPRPLCDARGWCEQARGERIAARVAAIYADPEQSRNLLLGGVPLPDYKPTNGAVPMNFKFKIDQRRALSLGIDAPRSTVVLALIASELPTRVREHLARVSPDGFDCTASVALLPTETSTAQVVAAVEAHLLSRGAIAHLTASR